MNLLLTFPPEIAKATAAGEPAPAGLSEKEKAAYEQRKALKRGRSPFLRHSRFSPANSIVRLGAG
jgi:hypothetical protein